MSQRAVLAAGAVAAAAAWLIRRTKKGDERRERAGSIAYDTKDELFHAMRKDAITAASREPWMAGILQHIIDARSFEDAVANMLMHKLAYETTNKQEMRRKFREALLVESVACRADAQAVCAGHGPPGAVEERGEGPGVEAERHALDTTGGQHGRFVEALELLITP